MGVDFERPFWLAALPLLAALVVIARLPWWQAAIVVAILSALCWAGVISILLAIGSLF